MPVKLLHTASHMAGFVVDSHIIMLYVYTSTYSFPLVQLKKEEERGYVEHTSQNQLEQPFTGRLSEEIPLSLQHQRRAVMRTTIICSESGSIITVDFTASIRCSRCRRSYTRAIGVWAKHCLADNRDDSATYNKRTHCSSGFPHNDDFYVRLRVQHCARDADGEQKVHLGIAGERTISAEENQQQDDRS